MLDDAIGSLRTLLSTSLVALALWLVAWPSTSEKLSLFAATVELQEWVELKDRLTRLERNVLDSPANEAILGDVETEQRGAPNEETYETPVDLVVDSTWPERRQWTVRMDPAGFDSATLADRARAYRVVGQGMPRSWERIYAVFLKVDIESEPTDREEEDDDADEPTSGIELGLVPSHYPGFDVPRPGVRQIQAALRDANLPPRWEELRIALLERGFDGEAGVLMRDDAALARLRSDVDVRRERGGISVLGVELSLAQFFAAIGIVLAVQAFLALGPLLTLRGVESRPSTHSWIFLLPVAHGAGRKLVEIGIVSVTLAWAAAPLVILALQIVSYVRLDSAPSWIFWPGALGLIASALVFGLVAWRLRALRVARAEAPQGPQ